MFISIYTWQQKKGTLFNVQFTSETFIQIDPELNEYVWQDLWFDPCHLVCHYKVDFFHLLDNVKNAENSAVYWKIHVLNLISITFKVAKYNKLENGIQLLKSLLYEINCGSKNLYFLHFFVILKTSGISGMQKESVTYCLMPSKVLSNKNV